MNSVFKSIVHVSSFLSVTLATDFILGTPTVPELNHTFLVAVASIHVLVGRLTYIKGCNIDTALLESGCSLGSVLGLRPPELVFRMLCVEGSVNTFISPSLGGSTGPVQPVCTKVA